jgi:hypothetical protein
MHDVLVAFAGSILPSIGILIVWLQNKARFDAVDARFNGVGEQFKSINQRFDDMRDLWRAELRRVEEVIDARLKHVEEK